MESFLLVAKINSPYGENGFVKISSFSDFPGRFFDLKKVYVNFFDYKKEFELEKVRQIKNFIALKFKNFDSADDVSPLLGKEILIAEKDAVKLPDDYFFIHDLIGSKVYRNSSKIGIVADVIKLPANNVFIIHADDHSEILLPAVEDYIECFDVKNKILTLKPGDEIFDDDEN